MGVANGQGPATAGKRSDTASLADGGLVESGLANDGLIETPSTDRPLVNGSSNRNHADLEAAGPKPSGPAGVGKTGRKWGKRLAMQAPDFWYPELGESGPRVSLRSRTLTPLGWLYDFAGQAKRVLTRSAAVDIPVVCVGNLTVGGTGKTPLTLTLGRHLITLGHTPAFLSRGYGGTKSGPLVVNQELHSARDVGDEPLLLSSTGMTVVSRNRPRGAKLAVDEGADIVIMDDGFQNPSLRKTINLLVIDGEALLGNQQVIPAGPLREKVSRGFKRADAIVVMGGAEADPLVKSHLERILAGFDGPIFRAHLAPDPDRLRHLLGKCYVAFAGIGRPGKFFATARNLGLDIVAQRAFPDHHVFTEEDMSSLDKDARRHSALLLTTEKDAMRLAPERRARIAVLPVRVGFDDPHAFWGFIADSLSRAGMDYGGNVKGR